jgi:3-methyladenine DNA glycosylase/8-oxoguanine DNA glycosylase
MATNIFLKTPGNFSFKHTIYSHGWSELLPFEIDLESWHLQYVFTDKSFKQPVSATISDEFGLIKIEIEDDRIGKKLQSKIVRDVRHILRLDEDLSEFYKLTRAKKELAWIEKLNVGRLVRSPTVFEDLIKTICTTNCSWSLTKKMVANLVEKLGEESKDGKRTFPTAEAMASVRTEFYREQIRAGYRSEYFAELAESVAGGKIDPESWLNSDLPTAELKKEMKKIKGVGDYAAENLLKLVGRYDGLALDSFLRAEFCNKHKGGMVCDDKEIIKFYEKFGAYRGLAIWFDMTKRWFESE